MTDAAMPTCPRESFRARKLLRAARRGDTGARERVIVEHLETVRAIAQRYANLGLSLDDLVQEGCIGLLEAIDRYDPSRHPDFRAFARFRIRRAIRNTLTEQSRLIRLPKHVVARRRLLARKEAELMTAGGRRPTPAQLASATGLSEAAVLAAQGATAAGVTLGLEPSPAALAADRSTVDPALQLIAADRSRIVRRAVDGLGGRQREVIRRRFGLADEKASVATLARDLRVSERRTRTIEHDALRALAHELEGALGGE